MSRRPTDYSGQRFGMLVVGTYEAGTWSCACDCGTVVQLEPVILRQARALDCGCLAEVTRRELVEGMVAQRELIARLEAAAEKAPEPAKAERRAPVPTRNVSPAAGRIDPVQYAVAKMRQERRPELGLS